MCFCNHSTVKEFHYVEGCPDYAVVLAEQDRFGYRNVCLLERMYYPVLSVHLMGSP